MGDIGRKTLFPGKSLFKPSDRVIERSSYVGNFPDFGNGYRDKIGRGYGAYFPLEDGKGFKALEDNGTACQEEYYQPNSQGGGSPLGGFPEVLVSVPRIYADEKKAFRNKLALTL